MAQETKIPANVSQTIFDAFFHYGELAEQKGEDAAKMAKGVAVGYFRVATRQFPEHAEALKAIAKDAESDGRYESYE